MIKIYESEGRIACQGFGFLQIIYWVIQNIESQIGINCCLQHYINESLLGKDLDFNEINTEVKKKSLHYHYI